MCWRKARYRFEASLDKAAWIKFLNWVSSPLHESESGLNEVTSWANEKSLYSFGSSCASPIGIVSFALGLEMARDKTLERKKSTCNKHPEVSPWFYYRWRKPDRLLIGNTKQVTKHRQLFPELKSWRKKSKSVTYLIATNQSWPLPNFRRHEKVWATCRGASWRGSREDSGEAKIGNFYRRLRKLSTFVNLHQYIVRFQVPVDYIMLRLWLGHEDRLLLRVKFHLTWCKNCRPRTSCLVIAPSNLWLCMCFVTKAFKSPPLQNSTRNQSL